MLPKILQENKFPTKTGFRLNIAFISTLANMMKSSATRKQLEVFCKNIFNYLDGKDIVQTTENKESVELSDKEPIR